MSALGQKPTCALQNLMSASPPIATAKADLRKQPCLLYSQKRTCAVQYLMSALGQKQTFAGLDAGRGHRTNSTSLGRQVLAKNGSSGL